jgi:ribosomal subunit interface protein
MKIDILYKNITPDEPLKVFVNDRIGGLEKLIGNDKAEARVEIGMPSKHHRSGPIFYAEINLKMGGNLLRASSRHEDLRTAIVDAKNELQREIKKFKDKKRDLSRKTTKA